jgi:hypothetical protein
MANYIPKIIYGSGPTTVNFDAPIFQDSGEILVKKETVSISLAGVRQVSRQYVEAVRKIKVRFLTESRKAELETFFLSHGSLGKEFNYYVHADEVTVVVYELVTPRFEPKKVAIAGGAFVYDLELEFRRVVA